MKNDLLPSDESLENDAVWKLLDQAPAPQASGSFADDMVRMVKLLPDPIPWWKRLLAPAPLAGFAGAAAAIALAVVFFEAPRSSPEVVASNDEIPAAVDPFADLQDFAETETLLAAADHLDEFSDQELVGLLGL